MVSTQETNLQHIQSYLHYLQVQRKYSIHTVSGYRRDLMAFANGLVERQLPDVTQADVRQFASQLRVQSNSARTISRKLSALRGFFSWMAETFSIAQNPVEGVRTPKKSPALPKALSVDDAVYLVSQTVQHDGKESGGNKQACNRAMFELLYSSGLRVSELVGLDLQYFQTKNYTSHSWLDAAAGEVVVMGKGQKQRRVPIGGPAREALLIWKEARAMMNNRLSQQDEYALFLTQRGTRMTPRTVQLRLKEHAVAVGAPVGIHPHILRHSFASHVLQSSGDLRAVQELLGHTSIVSTQTYTNLDFQRLAHVYDAAHPRAKKNH